MPRTPRSNRRPVFAGALACVAIAGLVLAGCGDDDDGGTTAQFCADVAANQDALFSSSVATPTDAADYVELYRRVGENAPLAVEDDWNAITAIFESATRYEPDSTELTEQDVLRQTFSSEQSALAVRDWLAENCQITISVATVPPPSLPATGAVASSTPSTG